MAVQMFRALVYWIFHGVYDFVCGAVRQTAALGFLDSNVPKKLERRVEIWMSVEQRKAISRSIAVCQSSCLE